MTITPPSRDSDVPLSVPDWDPQVIVNLLGNNQARNQRLLAKFLATAEDTVAGMRKALDASDMTELTRLTHGLKSSARSVGAMALGGQCAALEVAGRALDHARCAALVSDVAERFGVVKLLVQAHL